MRERDRLGEAIAFAVAESRSDVALVEELVDGLEVTVNAFSVGGEFFPLTVTDRLTAEPPAFGVARARLAERRAQLGGRRRRRALGGRRARHYGRPDVRQVRFGPDGRK